VADGVVSWRDIDSPSWHSLVIDAGRVIWWLRHALVKDQFPSLNILERGPHEEKVTGDDIARWLLRIGFPSSWQSQLAIPRSLNVYSHLKQELCRAADRRLITKRSCPGDEIPVTENDVTFSSRPATEELFVPGTLHKAILKALNGRALRKEALAEACRVDPSRLYRAGALPELIALKIVQHQRHVGYFRPDVPPADTVKVENVPKEPPRGHRSP
jgi:hypothetical protein